MKRICYLFSVWCLCTATTAISNADVLFESGTLGPTGMPQGSVAATNVSSNIFVGVRFELTQRVITEQIGGHFVDDLGGTLFGAIVKLDDAADFPNSDDLTTPDVLGAAQLTFPIASAEVFGELDLSLQPGWYALVFGTGLFATSGNGAAPRNNFDIGDPSYIGFGPNLKWFNLDVLAIPFENHRFVVLGNIVPEPITTSLVTVSACTIAMQRMRRKRMTT